MKTYRTYHRKSQCPWHMANHKRPENKTGPEKVFDRFSFPDWMQEGPHRCKKQSVSTGFIVLAWYKDTPDLLQRILEKPGCHSWHLRLLLSGKTQTSRISMCNALSTGNPPLTLEASPPHRTKYAGLWLLQQSGFIRATYSKHASTQHDWCQASAQLVSDISTTGVGDQATGRRAGLLQLRPLHREGRDDRLIWERSARHQSFYNDYPLPHPIPSCPTPPFWLFR